MSDLMFSEALWVEKKAEHLMIVGGELPPVGAVLEKDGELVQVIAHEVRVTRAFGGGKPKEHSNGTWRIVALPGKWDK